MIVSINFTKYEIYTFKELQNISSITDIITDDVAIQRASATLQCCFFLTEELAKIIPTAQKVRFLKLETGYG